MGSVTVFDAARMKQIEDSTVVSGQVDPNNHLLLTKRDGSQIDAGSVASNAKMSAEDTSSVDVTVGGTGSDLDPFRIKADVKKIPASAVDSGRFDLARIPDQTATGLLEATYRGGPAKVKVNGVLSSTAYNWMAPYQPGSSRVVDLLKTGDTWKIAGQNESETYPIELEPAMATTYSDGTGTAIFSWRPRATRLPSGIVVLSGLILVKSPIANGDIIGWVHPRCRPDTATRMATEFADISKEYIVNPDGSIRVYGNPVANQYMTLDGGSYPAGGVATWTEIGTAGTTFGANWERNPAWDAMYGAPAFWVDPYGFMWMRGLLRAKGSIVPDQIMAYFPNHDFYQSQHIRTAASSVLGAIGTDVSAKAINYKAGGPAVADTFITLCGSPVRLAASWTLNNWWYPRTLRNNWVNYNAAVFTSAAFCLREDGLRLSAGLVSSGTMAAIAAVMKEEEYWPRYGRLILPSFAANQRGRIDVSPANEIETETITRGSFFLQQGSATWYSLDSRVWAT